MKIRHKIIPASYVILMKDNQVLLMRRFNTGYADGQYGLPSGHVENNEALIDAAIRETKEEINIDLNKSDLRLVHVMHRLNNADGDRIDFFFVADKWQGEPKIMEADKCDDLRWVNLNDLDSISVVDYIKDAFKFVDHGVAYSDRDEGLNSDRDK